MLTFVLLFKIRDAIKMLTGALCDLRNLRTALPVAAIWAT